MKKYGTKRWRHAARRSELFVRAQPRHADRAVRAVVQAVRPALCARTSPPALRAHACLVHTRPPPVALRFMVQVPRLRRL